MPVEARAYPRPLPNPEWLGKLTEEILEPDLPIVDPHHHLWDHPASRYLLDELLADVSSGHNIVATVFIQCGSGYRTSGPEEMRPNLVVISCGLCTVARGIELIFEAPVGDAYAATAISSSSLVTRLSTRSSSGR
jgi:hypothetical protein